MDTCRTCRGRRVTRVIDLGDHPPAQRFMTPVEMAAPEPFAPLTVWACLDCALIQIPDNVPAGFFTHYLYVSSTSDRLVQHFRDFAATLVSRFITSANPQLADIGSCDGVLLEASRALGARPIGIEPAANLAAIARAKGLEVINEYFSPDVARRVRSRYGPMAVIAMSNTFNIMDDLDAVLEGVKEMLAHDGAFVLEVPQAVDLIENNEFDTIYHEHLSQFSVHSLTALFARHAMELFDLDRLSLHGGSMRAFVQHRAAGRPVSPAVTAALDREKQARLFEESTYLAFRERVEHNRAQFLGMLQEFKRAGKRIACYGAAAKGTTLLNYYRIGPDLVEFIADRNELKHGLYSPGMHIPVVAPAAILDRQPDYLVILAWNFEEEIMSQQEEYRRRGGRFLLPIPGNEVVE